jgi:hypothetical protein
MVKQNINVGTSANDRTGDPLRVAFTKTNENFIELYNDVAILNTSVVADISDLTDNLNSLRVKDYIQLNGILSGDGNIVTFTKPPNTSSDVYFDAINENIVLTRDSAAIEGVGGGIYNSSAESAWNVADSPALTVWNWDGWEDLTDIQNRHYETFRQVLKNKIGQNIVGAELVMKDIIGNEYYKIKFTQWSQGAAHNGGFSYIREKIDITSPVGLIFSDDSMITKAPDTRVKFPQSYIGDYGNYVITDKDVGRQLYTYGNILDLPSNAAYDFKIGDTIQIITGEQSTTIRTTSNSNPELPDAVLYIQGHNSPVYSYIMEARSMSFLTKTGTNSWQLSVGNNSISDNSKSWTSAANKVFDFVEWNSGSDITITSSPFETANAITYDSRTDSEYIYFIWDQDFIDNIWNGGNTPEGEGQSYSISLDGGETWVPVETSGYNGDTTFYFWIPEEYRETYSFTYDADQSAIIKFNRGSLDEVWFDLSNAPVDANTIVGIDMSVVVDATMTEDTDLFANIIRPNYSFMNVIYNDDTGEGSVNSGTSIWSGSSFVEDRVSMSIRKDSNSLDSGRIYAKFRDGKIGNMSFYWNAKLYTVS